MKSLAEIDAAAEALAKLSTDSPGYREAQNALNEAVDCNPVMFTIHLKEARERLWVRGAANPARDAVTRMRNSKHVNQLLVDLRAVMHELVAADDALEGRFDREEEARISAIREGWKQKESALLEALANQLYLSVAQWRIIEELAAVAENIHCCKYCSDWLCEEDGYQLQEIVKAYRDELRARPAPPGGQRGGD